MVSYALGYVGQATLWVACAAALAAIACLVAGHRIRVPERFGKAAQAAVADKAKRAESFTNAGYLLVFVVALALFAACAVIVTGFFTHNIAIQYVAQYYPEDTGSLFWLYRLSGLWAGRGGSLLTWGFLIALFASWVAWHRRHETDRLSNMALVVMMAVLVLFVAMMIFSSNNPFALTDPSYIEDGELTGVATTWGMNVLLEHWAMAIHPPTLFIGYAGLTVPFAYALAALVCNDPSKRWIELCNRIALFAFIFLTLGIGIGAVWAYVVLGWGGYWGWDPVENASLLSWLVAVAMIHSFTVYRKRGMMKGWALFTSVLAFVFAILGTWITRSGIVESVHAFSNDPVSTYLFMAIMLISLLLLLVLWLVRRKGFAVEDDTESLMSKSNSYYLTNIVMVFSAILVAYLTMSSAFPSWMPAGGMTVGTGAYETIARPLGVLFCALAAVCPFLAWKKTDGKEFWKNVRIPAVVAAVLFAAVLGHWAMNLYPVYEANLAQSDALAVADLEAMGPAAYYNGLAVVALLVGSLLVANSAYLVVRGVRARMGGKGESALLALGRLFAKSPAQAGGYLTHLGLGLVVIGLVGSAMYITDRTFSFSGTGETVQIGSYTLTLESEESYYDEDNNSCSDVVLSVTHDGQDLGTVNPTLEFTAKSYYGQARVGAETLSTFFEDLFIVYQGHNADGTTVVNVRINPLISLVWVGFVVMALGIVCATWPKRGSAALRAAQGVPGNAGKASPAAGEERP